MWDNRIHTHSPIVEDPQHFVLWVLKSFTHSFAHLGICACAKDQIIVHYMPLTQLGVIILSILVFDQRNNGTDQKSMGHRNMDQHAANYVGNDGEQAFRTVLQGISGQIKLWIRLRRFQLSLYYPLNKISIHLINHVQVFNFAMTMNFIK